MNAPSSVQMRLVFARMCRFPQKLLMTALIALPVATALAAPTGYSVNSDQPLGDTLHLIDLATGTSQAIGTGVSAFGVTRIDIEGLAMAPDSSLWGVDDDHLSLFQIDKVTGTVVTDSEKSLVGMDAGQFNDFGLTFTCDGSLYATSVTSQSLYQIDRTTGNATRVGALGSLGVNISAISSIGFNPVRIFGLGNGLLGDEGPVDNRSLYEISIDDGTVTLVGPIGAAAAPYSQAGLSFDDNGDLWAITDRSQTGDNSEILSIDPATGVGTVQAVTSVLGFESLAIAPPANCFSTQPSDELPETAPVPALDSAGKLLATLALLLAGLTGLRQRFS